MSYTGTQKYAPPPQKAMNRVRGAHFQNSTLERCLTQSIWYSRNEKQFVFYGL